MLQLKSLLGEQQLQPLQLQEAQQTVQKNDLAIQEQQQKLASRQAMVKAWSDPDVTSGITGSSGNAQQTVGFDPGFDPHAMIKKLVAKGVLPEDAMAQASSFLEVSKNLSLKTKDDLSNYKSAHEELSKLLTPIMDMKASEAGAAFASVKQQAAKIPGLDPTDIQHLQQADLEHLPALVNTLGFAGDLADFHKKNAEATAATPEGKAAIASAEAQAKLNVESSPQAVRLAGQKAAVEANARQQAAQGDPNIAGQMLAKGDLTLADLKSRGTTPQFITKAVSAAQKVNPTYNPADEVIAEQVAKSPSANQFFGSANSLIGKGGTLDQLEKLGKNIPQHDWPVLNTVDDWQKVARGKGPLSGYAATALGVADDYGKVMGGGNASDHARDAALTLFAQAASPEQRAQAISATRNAVLSQREGRIGNNQFLKRQYGTEVSKGVEGGGMVTMKAPNGATKQVSEDQVEHYKSLGATVVTQ